ncbi:MAG: AAC(3)-I family aminoglycoside N-acetyltransferase [Caldimonas sp.]
MNGFSVRVLRAGDVGLLRSMLAMFGAAFADLPTYTARQPDDVYLERLLGNPTFVGIAAVSGAQVVGGIAAYVLPKFEQARSELYLYDLAVEESHRRQGVATALISELRRLATERGAYVVFVQADREDEAAVALYSKLGSPQDVVHFDFPPLELVA